MDIRTLIFITVLSIQGSIDCATNFSPRISTAKTVLHSQQGQWKKCVNSRFMKKIRSQNSTEEYVWNSIGVTRLAEKWENKFEIH